MWTPAARAQLARPAKPYATCLTDAEWALAEPFLPPPAAIGRPRRWPMRTVLKAILYVLHTGCMWRRLPRDFPPRKTVLRWFLCLTQAGTFERIAHTLTVADRERAGRAASPTASGGRADREVGRCRGQENPGRVCGRAGRRPHTRPGWHGHLCHGHWSSNRTKTVSAFTRTFRVPASGSQLQKPSA